MIQPYKYADKLSNPRACVAVIQKPGQVLSTTRRNKPGQYGFPGGGRDGDEDPKACLIRELGEELGIIIWEYEKIHEGTDEEGNVVWVYLVVKYTGEPRQMEPGINVEWISWEDMTTKTPWPDFNKRVYEIVSKT